MAVVLVVLGLTVATFLAQVRAWAGQDWAHSWLLVSTVIAVLALLALWTMQGEFDDLSAMTLEDLRVTQAVVYDRELFGDEMAANVLHVEGKVLIRNGTEKQINPRFPDLQLLAAHGANWRPLGATFRQSWGQYFPGGRMARAPWGAGTRNPIGPRDEAGLRFFFNAIAPRGADDLVGNDLKLRLVFHVVAHPPLIGECRITKIDAIEQSHIEPSPASSPSPPPPAPP